MGCSGSHRLRARSYHSCFTGLPHLGFADEDQTAASFVEYFRSPTCVRSSLSRCWSQTCSNSQFSVSPVVGLRLYNLAPSQNLEHDKPSIQAQVFTQIAMDGAFLLASITCLKPFLRPFYSDYSAQVGADAQAYTVYDRKINRSRGEAYHELNHSRSKDGSNGKRSVIRSRHTDDGQPPLSLRPDKCEYEATAHADPRSKATGDENMLISKTQAWSVSYD